MLIRPYQACDNTTLRDIEIKCYRNPWVPQEFAQFGRMSMIGVADGAVVGYFCVKGVKLLRFAVTPAWRRMGLGRRLMVEAKKIAGTKLSIVIPESDTGSQLFLRECNFKCVNAMPKAYTDMGVVEDGLYFLWKAAYDGVDR